MSGCKYYSNTSLSCCKYGILILYLFIVFSYIALRGQLTASHGMSYAAAQIAIMDSKREVDPDLVRVSPHNMGRCEKPPSSPLSKNINPFVLQPKTEQVTLVFSKKQLS